MSNFITTLMLLLAASEEVSSKDLRVAASSYLSEPYTMYENGKLRGGLIKDIFDSLGTDLGVSIIYSDIPRKRVEVGLKIGEIHIAPVAHPQWLSKTYSDDWTVAVFTLKDLLILQSDSKLNYRNTNDLRTLRIGTTLGYHYPLLDSYFDAGTIIRSDVQKMEQNVDMLLSKRIDAYITHNIVFRYFQKTDPRASSLRAVELEAPERPISWAVSKKSPIPLEQLNNYIRKLRKNGRLDQILRKYRST